jgi:uncharacterized damage-inducible protein DinB
MSRDGGFVAEHLWLSGMAWDRLFALAEALPAESYPWRPTDAVRSVAEVLSHIGGGNRLAASSLGGAPTTLEAELREEKTALARAEVVARLRVSFDELRRLASAVDLDGATTLFGRPATHRQVLQVTAAHAFHHLGQLVAYARLRGVVPPWTASGPTA